jgi:hypothetical protein
VPNWLICGWIFCSSITAGPTGSVAASFVLNKKDWLYQSRVAPLFSAAARYPPIPPGWRGDSRILNMRFCAF